MLVSMLESVPITSHYGSSSHLPTHLEGRESQEGDNNVPIRHNTLERLLVSQLSSGNMSASGPRTPRSVASRTSFVPRRRPMSVNTVGSASDSVFYDAEDGGLEFVDFDGQTTNRQSDSGSDSDDDETEAREAARSIANASLSNSTSSKPADDTEDGYGGEDQTFEEAKTPIPEQHTTPALSIHVPLDRPKLGSVLSNVSSSSTVSLRSPEPATPVRKTTVVRRTRLPAPTAGEQMSLFTMLKRNIGKVRSLLANVMTIYAMLTLRSPGSVNCRIPCHVGGQIASHMSAAKHLYFHRFNEPLSLLQQYVCL